MCGFELVCVFGNGCVYCDKIVALTVFDLKGGFFLSEKVVFFFFFGGNFFFLVWLSGDK